LVNGKKTFDWLSRVVGYNGVSSEENRGGITQLGKEKKSVDDGRKSRHAAANPPHIIAAGVTSSTYLEEKE